ncbi:MAG TPA: DUF1553 domain-containing protein, partial [Chthonomonadaceae bacterium]|nr:DUF1553 domain-containing protein [Chthonomonadaceae bacterium]
SPDNNRRTFYAAVSRHDLDSMLRLFDFPDPNATTDARMTTTVPLQQLFVLNSDFMVRQAKALAARLTDGGSQSDSARIDRAFSLLFNRAPTERERALGLAFLQSSAPAGSTGTAATTTTTVSISAGGQSNKAAPPAGSKLTRWEEYAQILLASNEFMYVD